MTALPRVSVSVGAGRLDSPAAFVLLSLVGHVAAMGGLLAAASLVPAGARTRPPDPGFFVSLAQLPPGGGARTEAAAPRPPAREETAPPAAEKPPEKKEVVLPEKPQETRSRPSPPKADPAPRREAPAADAAPGGSPGSPGEAGIPGAPPGPGVPGGEGDISLSIADFEHAWYSARVISRLRGVWKRPYLGEGEARTAIVQFTIHRDGRISNVAVAGPSGLELLDLSAVRAVYDAAPLPPLPTQWKGDSLTAYISFELTPDS